MNLEAIVLSCEHGGNQVPPRYRFAFETPRAAKALQSHRGYDLGALFIAESLAKRFRVRLIGSHVSRLVVDLNRSPGHPRLLSEFMSGLDGAEREKVLRKHYFPHRERVESEIRRHVAKGRTTLHVGIHSFTPRLGGNTRRADLGLLYDPKRAQEKELCVAWRRSIRAHAPELRVRRNYPYRGDADGLTTTLRRVFAPDSYLGIELELNQALLTRADGSHEALAAAVGDSLASIAMIVPSR